MAYKVTDAVIGFQPITETSTTQNHPLGSICKGRDPTYGDGRFIYLKGVANTTAGDLVIWDNSAGTTTLCDAGASTFGPCAVAMSANVASQYGWYQIEGVASINASEAIDAGDALWFSATAGSVVDTDAATESIFGARAITTTTSGPVLVEIRCPHGAPTAQLD